MTALARTAALALVLLFMSLTVGDQSPAGPGSTMPPPGPVFQALERAYPRWVAAVDPFQGLFLSVGGKRFAWAEGRLLPESLAADWGQFAPQPFYEYPAEEPDVAHWSDEAVAQAEQRLAARRATVLKRNSAFYDALWGITDRGSADENQQRAHFLGLAVTVHRSLVEPLQRVEQRLLDEAKDDEGLSSFLKSLIRLEGFNWRPIAETQSRSNHSYGAAIDLVPRTWRGKNAYWLWAPQDRPGWYREAWSDRWRPHPLMVRAFEAEGFIWGGKWLAFDTIHFEYRPEILVLNGLR